MDRIRTLGIVAHIDAGKTTLTEHILFDAGRQAWAGAVDDGTATMDWSRQEQERGITILAAATSVQWQDHRLQIVDTPGHVDFTAEVERCLRVLDGLVVVLDGVRGVESQTRTVWRHADRWRCARLVFVNKLDRAGADFATAVQSLRQAFGCRPVPVVVPLYDADGNFAGLGDALRGRAQWFEGDLPEELRPLCGAVLRSARDALVEAGADVDESIFADYVAGRPIAADRLAGAIRRGCLGGDLVPVVCGAALLDRGVDLLLDAVCAFLPSPVDRSRAGLADAFPDADAQAPVCALVFKVEHADGEVRNYLRVFRGTLRMGAVLRNARSGVDFAVDAMWSMHASEHEPLADALPGTIVVLPARADLQTGDTLHAAACDVVLAMPPFSPPVIAAAFEPATPADAEPMLAGLRELQADDPTLHVERDPDSGLPLVFGMGELHLEVVAERLRERARCRFSVSRPRVALRGGVRGEGAGSATVVAPGGAASAGAAVAVAPRAGVDRCEIDLGAFAARGDADSLQRALDAAATVRGLPLHGARLRVERLERARGGEDSDALLAQAVRVATAKAIEAAQPTVLEPMVAFEVRCPAERRAAVHADLAGRGAVIRQVSSGQLGALLQGRGRLAAFLGYSTRLRSITQGQGEAQLQPEGYEPEASDDGAARARF